MKINEEPEDMGKYYIDGEYVNDQFKKDGDSYFEDNYNKMNVDDIDVTEAMGKKIDSKKKNVFER